MAPIPDMRGFVPGPTTRGTFNILWSCLSTLFVCIWTSVHPDIRFHFDMTPKNLTMQKLFLAMSMLLMPEMMLVRVITEHIEARWIARQFNSQFPACSWTLADAYYVTMNGYILKNEAIGHEDLLKLMQEGQIDPVTSDELSIRDRSKADSLAKLIACCQIIWLMIQCLARAIEGLPMSALELGTVGTAFMAVIAYGFQWHKPKDILRPIVLQPRNGKRGDNLVADASRLETSLLQGDEEGDIAGNESRGDEGQVEEAKADFLRFAFQHRDKIGYWVQAMVCLLFGGWHCLAWNFTFPTFLELWLWRFYCIFCMVPGLFLPLLAHSKHYTREEVLLATLALFHLASRATALVLMFIGLRRLPAGVFETVRWTTFLPHI
ncbi:hypothetical protein DENSPDRAFT_277477 [Dentipellis sp. KUC8613]|nr:hypothetical protein DENSPDRAFT_277477 [Dentipellis sp. KUC8613]